jgi:hypothetical protein
VDEVPDEFNLEAVVAWQMDLANKLIIDGILEGRAMADPEEVKRVWEIVAEQTKAEFGI